jgi:hypothetical protein
MPFETFRRSLVFSASMATAGGLLLARATTAQAEATPRPVEVGLGPHAGMVFGDLCSRDGDVVGCTQGAGFAGLQVAPRWRLSPALSIGGLGAVALGSGTADSDSQTWWRGAAELRLHPAGAGSPDLAFGVDAGVVAVIDRAPRMQTQSHVAPAFGATVALDFAITQALALGAELRVLSFLFSGGEALPHDLTTSYGPQLGVALAVTLTIRAGE